MGSSSPPRAVWTGSVTVGLVVLPVRLYSATEERAVRLHEIHKGDSGRIRHRRVCSLDGQEVSYEDVGRGYELSLGGILRHEAECGLFMQLSAGATDPGPCHRCGAIADLGRSWSVGRIGQRAGAGWEPGSTWVDGSFG